jgi:release factor glutamine methyltransferase
VDSLVARLRAAGCVYADDEARILVEAATSPEELRHFAELRVSGVPLEHVVGFAEFCGRRVAVAPGVFVPRRRSELLVAAAAPLLGRGDVVVDLCCGSGAIGAALAAAVPAIEVHAVDVDPAAAACAAGNLSPHGGRVYTGDLFSPLPTRLRGHLAVVTANAPYVPSGEIDLMPAEARDHEPAVALDGGPDGVAIHRRIAAIAPEWLAAGGALVLETSDRQATATAEACDRNGLTATVQRDDDHEAVVVIATKPGARPRT